MSKPNAAANFATAFRALRIARRLPQEAFGEVSGRTYVSKLERSERIPTLNKVDELATVLNVHPLTLMALSYCLEGTPEELDSLLHDVREELRALGI